LFLDSKMNFDGMKSECFLQLVYLVKFPFFTFLEDITKSMAT
jgi:hypothetical protein